MNKHFIMKYALIVFVLFFFNNNLYPGSSGEDKPKQLNKPAYQDSGVKFNINNISTIIYNNGKADLEGNDSGFEYPKGSNKTAIYTSGFVWGAKLNGEVRVGGSTYASGLSPGKILDGGIAEDPNSERVRIYRVRRDFKKADLNMEAEDENKSVGEIFYQYEKDWNEWPANDGAPFEDIDGNGIYNSNIDIPGIPGADQTLWFVANDLDSNQTKLLYGSLPLGIEMQVTIWGYNMSAPLGNAVFKKYTIINKSNNDFEDMYFGIFADPDLGDAANDLVGCDTTLNLGYVYNGDSYDAMYQSLNPPTVGFCLLQGPIVNGLPDDEAMFNGKIIQGKKNQPMTAFSYPYKHGVDWGEVANEHDLYYYLNGKTKKGEPWPIPEQFGGGTTRFPLSGNPVSLSGFYDGVQYSQGDRRLMVCTGSFNMAVGDTQEVVFMQIAAGADGQTNYLSAIDFLKFYTNTVISQYKYPEKKLSANYKLNTKISLLDRTVLLDWGNDQNQIDRIEKGDYVYKFQGYNVYQFPSQNSKLDEGKLIATYDIVDGVKQISTSSYDPQKNAFVDIIMQNGSDSGIKRFFLIEKDYLTNQSLAVGEDYYFGVTYYSFNGEEKYVNNLENGLIIQKITPQFLPGGISFIKNHGDTITAVKKNGTGEYTYVYAFIVDPNELTGDEYEVTFRKENELFYYTLKNITINKILFENRAYSIIDFNNLITDGFVLQVRISSSRYFSESDVFGFKTDKAIYNEAAAKNEVDLVNVFPNPYYAVQRQYDSQFNRHVTFTHLPEHAVIRIFNLAGELIYKMEKNNNTKIAKWYLMNNQNVLAPTGLYIVYIEMPEAGKTKILKLAVVQGELLPGSF